MAPSPSRRRRRDEQEPAPPRYIPFSRLAIILPVFAFLIALGVQTLSKAAGLEATNPIRTILTPLVAAAIVFLGLRPYPRLGRIRLALMVAVGLFLYARLT
jgi:hypothetical protein